MNTITINGVEYQITNGLVKTILELIKQNQPMVKAIYRYLDDNKDNELNKLLEEEEEDETI